MNKRVLFLCSGNYYRSRYAEELFNYFAKRDRLPWSAFSRGLRTEGLEMNVGPISYLVVEQLRRKSISSTTVSRFPAVCDLFDLESAKLVIAMKEAEHRPLMRSRFPVMEDAIRYWNVDDIDCTEPQVVLPQIDRLISELVLEVKSL